MAVALYAALQAVDGVALTHAVEFRLDRPALFTLKRRRGDAPEDEVLAAPSIVRQRQSTMRQLGALTLGFLRGWGEPGAAVRRAPFVASTARSASTCSQLVSRSHSPSGPHDLAVLAGGKVRPRAAAPG